jgi:hypothetical protein
MITPFSLVLSLLQHFVAVSTFFGPCRFLFFVVMVTERREVEHLFGSVRKRKEEMYMPRE